MSHKNKNMDRTIKKIYTAPSVFFILYTSIQHFIRCHYLSDPSVFGEQTKMQMSVMQSEDDAFFYHHGFLLDAMREALIHDLKVHRFARGGSTISMQIVKDIFLNRKKNIAHKLEEALIIWLIETEHLTSKSRMYEVYLNIAE